MRFVRVLKRAKLDVTCQAKFSLSASLFVFLSISLSLYCFHLFVVLLSYTFGPLAFWFLPFFLISSSLVIAFD